VRSATGRGSARATSSRSRSRTPPRRGTRRRRSRLPARGYAPSYGGNPDITEESDPEAFINAHDFGSMEELAGHVLKVDDDLYLRCLSAPRFADGKLPEDAGLGSGGGSLGAHLLPEGRAGLGEGVACRHVIPLMPSSCRGRRRRQGSASSIARQPRCETPPSTCPAEPETERDPSRRLRG